jgi:hypothetical protein
MDIVYLGDKSSVKLSPEVSNLGIANSEIQELQVFCHSNS